MCQKGGVQKMHAALFYCEHILFVSLHLALEYFSR